MALAPRYRQIIFGSAFILVIAGIVAVFYLLRVQPELPVCTDGIKNGLEEGPDCGGPDCIPCAEKYPEPLKAEVLKRISYGSGLNDVLVKIKNPNAIMDAKNFQYIVEMADSNGRVIASNQGFYSLAVGKEFLFVESAIAAQGGVRASVKAVEVKWAKKSNIAPPFLKVEVDRFGPGGGGETGNFFAEGFVGNESLGRLNRIDAVIVLYNATGQIVGFNKVQLADFKPFERRPFRLIWFSPVEGIVAQAEGYAATEMKYYLNQ